MKNKTIKHTCTPSTGLSRKMWEAVLYGSASTASAKRMAKAFSREAGLNTSIALLEAPASSEQLP